MATNVTKRQPYEPLDKKELTLVDKLMKEHAPQLRAQVYTQLLRQEHYLLLEKNMHYARTQTTADRLRDIADEVESMQDELENLQDKIERA